ncbi:hypothetical protein KDC22_04950 [Paenibacillus tritici]|uniref:phosphopantetheine-binding protein n=1 Tax=Paenibacillus tritici TaxID=1873425 RepID=UPI001BA58BED|nr:phosphopantetheine-binding protein [Paenibacillus tritici]QUL55897.1 hypothetical protein KDC22_04950 [Paenibacillus tritici]
MNLKEEIITNLQTILVNKLRLPLQPSEIDSEMELFNNGLGLDSVDSLELIAAIHEDYGIELNAEHTPFFRNLNTLSEYISSSLAAIP